MTKYESVDADAEQPIVHTPGPWEVREHEGLFAIAHPCGWVLESNDEQQDRADAKLIAAAPMMLEALRRIVRHQDYIGGSMASMSSTRHIAAQAIQYATGDVV
jgi:hypothetical protein